LATAADGGAEMAIREGVVVERTKLAAFVYGHADLVEVPQVDVDVVAPNGLAPGVQPPADADVLAAVPVQNLHHFGLVPGLVAKTGRKLDVPAEVANGILIWHGFLT
jgi:hypothetical protein